MRTFLISYDPAKSTGTKLAMATTVMNLGQAWARPLETTWYVRTTASKAEIDRRLRDLLEGEDGVIIQPVSEDASLLNTSLRWFRQRRTEPSTTNVIAFPVETPKPLNHPEIALAEAV